MLEPPVFNLHVDLFMLEPPVLHLDLFVLEPPVLHVDLVMLEPLISHVDLTLLEFPVLHADSADTSPSFSDLNGPGQIIFGTSVCLFFCYSILLIFQSTMSKLFGVGCFEDSYVSLTIFQLYRDLEAGDTQSQKFNWVDWESNPEPLCSRRQELNNHSTIVAPCNVLS